MASKIPTFKLNNGKETPALGYGTWQATDQELEDALEMALEAGYRHIDTATVYGNEKVIGRVLKRWLESGKLKRDDLFITTKLPLFGMRPSGVVKYLNLSLENLQLDYIDLYLIHVPVGFKEVDVSFEELVSNVKYFDFETDHVAIWREMEKQVEAGLTRAIGLSNFNKNQIERILKNCKILPSALQVELHVYFQQNELVDFCKKNNILVTAYSPLGTPGISKFMAQFDPNVQIPDILGNPTVKKIAKKHGKTEAQILLRYDVERGILAIPKSTNPARLRQNLNVFDFELDKNDTDELRKLDKGIRIADMKLFDGFRKHPEFPF